MSTWLANFLWIAGYQKSKAKTESGSRKGLLCGARIRKRKDGCKDLTFPAQRYLFLPAFLPITLANCSVDAPAEMPGMELPCRTILSSFHRTFFDRPTGTVSTSAGPFQRQKKQRLAFGMDGNPSPALLKTLDGFYGNTQ